MAISLGQIPNEEVLLAAKTAVGQSRIYSTLCGGIAVGTNERATQERETFAARNPLLIVSPEGPMRAQHTNKALLLHEVTAELS